MLFVLLSIPIVLSGCAAPAVSEPVEPSMLDIMLADHRGERALAGVGITADASFSLALSHLLAEPLAAGEFATGDLVVAVEEDPQASPERNAAQWEDRVRVSGQFVCGADTALSPRVAAVSVQFGGGVQSADPEDSEDPEDSAGEELGPGITLGEVCAGGADPEAFGSGSGPNVGFRVPVTLRMPATLPDGSVPEPLAPAELPDELAVRIESRESAAPTGR